MTTRLLVARHGNTFNKGDVVTRLGGRTDLPLVASGEQQARDLGVYLRTQKMLPDVIFSGALKRARTTAEIARDSMGLDGMVVTPLEMFNEIDYGPDENMPEDVVVARLGTAALDAWNRDAIVPQGWNVDPQQIITSWIDFGARVARDYTGKTVLAVTSNGIARFAPHLTGDFAGFAACHDIKLSTGALCVFEYDGGKWHCRSWNVKPN